MTGEILAVIPARGGSKGIPRKNIRELGDRPLVAHAIETSQDAELVDSVVLTTDNQEIAQIGQQYSVDQVVHRPEQLSTDEVPLAPVVEHAYGEVDTDYEYVLCFQPTVPLVTASSVDEGIRTSVDADVGSVIFVRDNTHHYWKDVDGTYEPVTSDRKNRQLMDPIYEEIGIFLTRKDVLRGGARVDSDPDFYEVPTSEGIDIDTYQDWILAESQLERKRLFYRVIGNRAAGTGHVFRGITIADHIFEHDILFAVKESDDLAIEKLEESNYEYRVFEDQAGFVEFAQQVSSDIIVNDILDTSTEYMDSLRTIG